MFDRTHQWNHLDLKTSFFFFPVLLFIYFFLIFIFTLFYFTVLCWFCHTLTWILHGCTPTLSLHFNTLFRFVIGPNVRMLISKHCYQSEDDWKALLHIHLLLSRLLWQVIWHSLHLHEKSRVAQTPLKRICAL